MSRISALVAAKDDTQAQRVKIGPWDGIEVEIRGMSLHERGAYIADLVEAREAAEEGDTEPSTRLDAKIVVFCTYDPEDGTKAFTEGDIPMLLEKAASAVFGMSVIAQRLSGLDGQAEERLGKDFSISAQTGSPEVVGLPNADSSSGLPAS